MADLEKILVEGDWYPADAALEALLPHLSEARIERYEAILSQRLASVALGVENLHKSFNASACLRTAEALGLQDVAAIEDQGPLPIEEGDGFRSTGDDGLGVARKVSKTAYRWLDLHSIQGPEALRAFADERGMRLFGAGPRGTLTLTEVPVNQPLLVVFGNEHAGLRPETEALCDDCFRIPMAGFCESFNVSVSVGISLHHLTEARRRMLAEQGQRGDLPEPRARHLMAQWAAEDVRAAGPILRRKLGSA